MVFNKNNKYVITQINIDNHPIELTVNQFRLIFLRIPIDNRMTWKEQINYVFNKLRIVSFIFNKAFNTTNIQCLY